MIGNPRIARRKSAAPRRGQPATPLGFSRRVAEISIRQSAPLRAMAAPKLGGQALIAGAAPNSSAAIIAIAASKEQNMPIRVAESLEVHRKTYDLAS